MSKANARKWHECPYSENPEALDALCYEWQCETCGWNPAEQARRVEKIRRGEFTERVVTLKDQYGHVKEFKTWGIRVAPKMGLNEMLSKLLSGGM